MVSANFPGSYEPGQGCKVVQAAKGTSAGIIKGDVLSLVSDKWVTATVNAAAPFGVAVETKLTADTTISVLTEGIVYVTADGTINPNSRVQVSGATAGQVIASTDITATQSGAVTFRNVGIYLGHENEGDGVTIPTAAADGDVIRISLGDV